MTFDIRYVGTQGRRLLGDININLPNIYFNPEMLDALNTARNGGDSPLLTQMLAGLNLGSGVIGQGVTGAQALRTSTAFNQNLINGNFIGVVNTLISGTGVTVTSGAANHTGLGVTPSSRLIRNGCDRIANGQPTLTVFSFAASPRTTSSRIRSLEPRLTASIPERRTITRRKRSSRFVRHRASRFRAHTHGRRTWYSLRTAIRIR
jgi:hypothetical protein